MADTVDEQDHAAIRGAGRAAIVLATGLAVGVITAFATGAMANPDQGIGAVGFWGLFFAVPAGLAAAAVTLAVVGGGSGLRRVGLYALAGVLGLFGALVTWSNVVWGIPLNSLEGAWLWPLAAVPLLSAALVGRAARRRGAASGSVVRRLT